MRRQLLVPVACAMAVCLALVGCGESAPAEPEATEEVVEEVAEPDGSEYIGTWELYEMKDADEVISHEDLMATKDAADSYVYLVVNEDGNFDLDVFGTVTSGTCSSFSMGARRKDSAAPALNRWRDRASVSVIGFPSFKGLVGKRYILICWGDGTPPPLRGTSPFRGGFWKHSTYG